MVGGYISSLTPDPRKESAAYAQELAAESKSASEDQARRQQQAAWELKQKEREAVTKEVIAGWKKVIPWIYGIGMFCAACMGLAMAFSVSYASVGISRAAVVKANLNALQISMDPRTFTFPALASPDGRFLADINTRTNMPRQEAIEPYPQLVDSMRSRAEIAMQNYQAAHGIMNHMRIDVKADGEDVYE
jgi:hypothetical protein